MRKFLGIFILLSLLLSSCYSYRSIAIEDFKLDKIKLVSASKINLDLIAVVENGSKATFELVDIDGMVYKDDMPFAKVSLLEDCVMPPFYDGGIPIHCRAELIDPMAVLVMGLDFKSWSLDDFTVDVKVVFRKGILRKSFTKKNIPLEKLIKKFNL